MTPDQITTTRMTLGLSPRRLAAVMAVDLATVLRWETGTTEPRGLALEVLSALYAIITTTPPAGLPRIASRIQLGIGPILMSGLLDVAGDPR